MCNNKIEEEKVMNLGGVAMGREGRLYMIKFSVHIQNSQKIKIHKRLEKDNNK